MTSCTLCDLPTDGVDITDDDENAFCCRGCLDVYETLEDVEDARRGLDTDEVPRGEPERDLE